MKEIVKRDLEINWKKAINFIPKKDEIIIYDCDDGIKVKIGDGIHTVNELDFSVSKVIISSNGKVEGDKLII